jgi:alanyl-tRNA synthetase
VPGFSKELCGGTHVPATGTIGMFKVVAEGGVAAGIRRLEAVTGAGALERFDQDERILELIQSEHKVQRDEIPAFLEKLQSQMRDLQKQVAELELRSARAGIAGLLHKAREIHGIKVVASTLPPTDRANMRALADELKQRVGSGIVILGTPQDQKAALVVMVSADLAGRIPAGAIIREIAPLVGGAGGGRPELAEAGGKDSTRLADAVERSYSVVEALLSVK